jgi:hypothetical protein
MYLHEVYEQFEYWQSNPPTHELLAGGYGAGYVFKKQKTKEEMWAEGAMSPRDFALAVKMTGGKRITQQ